MGHSRHKKNPARANIAPPRWRQWLFRLLAPVLAPLIVFGALEGALRLGGYGYPTSYFLHRNYNNREFLVENPRFNWRFFGPTVARAPYPTLLPAVKPSGTVRIFVFGESAAFGDPDPDFGLHRMLRALLQDRFPGVDFEVVNTAMVAINSNVILPIARECARRDGDIWVVYMGNNEVVGPYGAGTVFGPKNASRALIRGSLAAKATRTGQLLGSTLQHLGLGPVTPSEWKGMMMFAQNKLAQDDPRMQSVYSHFRDNLSGILKAGLDHHVKIIVSTVASNLKDCAPFASLHRPGISAAELNTWDNSYKAGIQAEEATNLSAAIDSYKQAAAIDDHFADLQFRWARCALAMGSNNEARAHFGLARDRDALRFRADSHINEIIRQLAQSRENEGIFFFDTVSAFAAASPGNLPGNELLYEHVHLTFSGNFLLARNLADKVAQALPDEIKRRIPAPKQWLSQEECARSLVWTDWSENRALQNLPIRFPPFTDQLNHNEQYRRVEQRLEQLRPGLNPAALQRYAVEFQQALAKSPNDWTFHRNLAQLLQRLGDLPGSVRSWEKVLTLLPQNGEAHLRLGLIFMQQGRMSEALHHFEAELDRDPQVGGAPFVRLLNETATEMLQQGHAGDAIRMYRQALEFKPDAAIRLNLGLALISTGSLDEAHECFKSAMEQGLDSPQSLILLGETCLTRGWINEAINAFERTLRLDPADAFVHCRLADSLAAASRFPEAREQYAAAVRLKPDFAEAHSRLGAELGRGGNVTDAIKEFAEALRLNPRLAEAHVHWGIVLFDEKKQSEARQHFEEALRINPGDATAQRYLEKLKNPAPGGL